MAFVTKRTLNRTDVSDSDMFEFVEEQRWYRVDEVAELLGLKADTISKRASRHMRAKPDDSLVRRAKLSDEGGKPRLEINGTLVASWLDAAASESGATSSALLRETLQRERRDRLGVEAELSRVEIARRDEEIARLTETLMAREFEIADLRSRNETLGQVIADLTKSSRQ